MKNLIILASNLIVRSSIQVLSIIFITISNPAFASDVGRIILPIMLSPDDARTQPETTVRPMLSSPVDIIGPRRVSFRSTANISKELQIGKKGKEIAIFPSDLLLEYDININENSFSAYCKSYKKRPINGLVCLSDTNSDGIFDQMWLGEVANPNIMVPFPYIKLQEISISQEYFVQQGPIPSNLQFGFSITSAGGLENKRELHLQITDGDEKVYIFYNRIVGPSRIGDVDTKIFDAQIRLYGHDSKSVTYSIEKPFSKSSYGIFHPGLSQNVWIYVPG